MSVCQRFLAQWNDGHAGLGDPIIALCELAPILARAAQHLPDICRWRDALLHTADARYAEAADFCTQIGSFPLAADAHLSLPRRRRLGVERPMLRTTPMPSASSPNRPVPRSTSAGRHSLRRRPVPDRA